MARTGFPDCAARSRTVRCLPVSTAVSNEPPARSSAPVGDLQSRPPLERPLGARFDRTMLTRNHRQARAGHEGPGQGTCQDADGSADGSAGASVVSGSGMMISSPTLIRFGFAIVSLFAARSASSDTPNRRAILDRVSPALIV